MVLDAERPLIMLGAAASRPRLAESLSDFVHRVRIPFFNTQMGKGAVVGGSNLYMGTAALSERDYVYKAISRADLILSVGHAESCRRMASFASTTECTRSGSRSSRLSDNP
jgi:acetolactate synthase I/II/III large subunit